MKNIFLFIRRHFNFLFFLLLQVVCLNFIIQFSNYHRAAFGGVMNRFTLAVNKKVNGVRQYFYLKQTNDSLVKANERLYNKLKSEYALGDSVSVTSYIDSINLDSVSQYRKYTYIHAKVVSNSVSQLNNYIVLDRGTAMGINIGMGVVDYNNGVVGIVTEADKNYSVVMSVLHKDSHISGKLAKTGETGSLSWDGMLPNEIYLSNISKSTKVLAGDTVISSGFSTSFPKGLKIGYIQLVSKENNSNFLKIKIKTSVNFYNLDYVYVIKNVDQVGVKRMLDKIKPEH